MKRAVLYILVSLFILSVSAQLKKYKGADYLIIGGGPNYMFGDAGGSSVDIHLMANDWDVLYTRPSFSLAYQHDYNEFWGIKLTVMYSMFAGSDLNSRNPRAYEYEASSIETSLQMQLYLYRGLMDKRNYINPKTYDLYVYAGVAGVYYHTFWKYIDPITRQLRHDNITGELLPARKNIDFVSTEAVFNNGKQMFEFAGTTLAIPFGIGIRFPVSNNFYLGAEFGWSYLFGPNADFLDGFYTKYSEMNDSYSNLKLILTYKFSRKDCFTEYRKRGHKKQK